MEKSIIIEQEYPYSPEEVWDALTDQDQLNEWLMEGNFQPRVGAEYEFYWVNRAEKDKGKTEGKVLEVLKPKKLSYTWEGGGSSTVVTFFLEPSAEGTKLRLEHTGFVPQKDEFVYNGALYGWKGRLANLPAAIAKRQKAVA